MRFRILLLYKKSSFENYLSTFTSREIRRFERTHQLHYQSIASIEGILKAYKLNYDRRRRGQRIDYSKYNLVITVGGDGTFLEASHFIKDQLIIGVNSDPSWSVGRFCAANALNFEEYLNKIIASKANIQRLPRLKVQINQPQNAALVLNDILICHKNPAAMSRYYISKNKHKEEQRSSGIWVSTAAGSTSAIHSAGGIVLKPQDKTIQYKVRELYLGNNQAAKLEGGLLKPAERLNVESLMREGVIYIDGSHICFKFPFGSKAVIQSANCPLNMIWK